jgi:hypothetical protein
MGGIDESHRYQHSWEDMPARHEAFTAALSDRITVPHAAGHSSRSSAAVQELSGQPANRPASQSAFSRHAPSTERPFRAL